MSSSCSAWRSLIIRNYENIRKYEIRPNYLVMFPSPFVLSYISYFRKKFVNEVNKKNVAMKVDNKKTIHTTQ